ncbi:MAG TPA: hypothetical protein V6D17_23305 [Candidatus Obscuribacterales bacterium]
MERNRSASQGIAGSGKESKRFAGNSREWKGIEALRREFQIVERGIEALRREFQRKEWTGFDGNRRNL